MPVGLLCMRSESKGKRIQSERRQRPKDKARRQKSGERTRLACWFWRLAETRFVATVVPAILKGEEKFAMTTASSLPREKRALPMQFVCVSKTLQHRIVSCRFEQLQDRSKDLVQKRICVAHVQIERKQITPEMQLRLIVQRAAPVTLQTLAKRPAEDVAQGMKIKMEIEGDCVIKPEVIVIDRALMHECNTEGNRFSVLPPDEEAGAIRHPLAES